MNNAPSNIVWSAHKGWHDGPPVEVKVVLRHDAKRARTFAAIHAAAKRVNA